MELVIASHNTCKVQRLREFLKELLPHIHTLSLFDFPHYKLPPDDGEKPFNEQARAKALHAATQINKWCLAEQGSLIIPAMGAAQKALFEQSMSVQTKRILEALKSKSELERSAYLESVVAIASPSGTVREAVGRTEGMIAEKESGKSYFEFDTLFIKHDYNKTLADLPRSTWSRISHQRKAIEKLLPYICNAT